MNHQQGSITLMALFLGIVTIICAMVLWQFCYQASRYNQLEKSSLLHQFESQQQSAVALAAAKAQITSNATSSQEFLVCNSNTHCLRTRLFARDRPQPRMQQLLIRHSRDLCQRRFKLNTAYSPDGCEVLAKIPPTGGYIDGNVSQNTPITFVPKVNATTRFIVLGSLIAPTFQFENTISSARVEVIVFGDLTLDSVDSTNLPASFLIHVVRGKVNIQNGLPIACRQNHPIRIESKHPIQLGARSLPRNFVGCDIPREGDYWSSEFLLGVVQSAGENHLPPLPIFSTQVVH